MHVYRSNNMFIFVILCCVSIVSSYNVDTNRVIYHQGPKNSMFGFTVAAHIERGSSMVLVGAPKAQTRQPEVTNGGAVYRCEITRNNTCYQIPFDQSGDVPLLGKKIDQKSHQWFGSTLFSSGPEGPVVACASRYVWFSTKHERRDPVGTCYIARNDFRDFAEYSPCRTSQWGYHRQGSCQAGFSAAISKDGNNLFVGAPGNCYWQGRMYSIDAQAKFPYRPPLFGPFGTGKVIRQSLHIRPSVFHTLDGSAADDDSYLGYSLAVGNFTGDRQQGIAAGMPRGGGLYGKIILYTWNLTNFMNITGRQMGSYFGYAVAAADVDGDQYDDLIIGAPLFTEPNNEGKYEVGKVYVVYQISEKGKFRKLDELDGLNSKSRFGLSLASLGDINLDGYTDFAVGAPYDGPHERGAVYIFHGSKNGVRQKYTQVIYAEEVNSYEPPSTFGFSLAGGIDLDRNDYPDTVIGAYLSDTTFFLRSRPVVKVTGYAQFQTANKEIVLEDKHCRVNTTDGPVSVACTTIETCLNYTGIGVPREISLRLNYTLDTQKKKDSRMFFIEDNANTWQGVRTLSKDSRSSCTKKVVYIKRDIRDKLTSLDVKVTYVMDGQHYYYGDLPPVLDLTSTSLKKDSITIRKNCGSDNVCVPDLSLEMKPNVERYLLASNEVLYFDITVSNNGEDSFETMFSIKIPEDVNYMKIEDTGDVRISCREFSNNYTISCDIANPLPAKKIVNFKMFFKPHYKEGMQSVYVFNAEVSSANLEDASTLEDNKVIIELPIWVNSRLELTGASRPSEVHYNWSYYAEKEQVKHEREIGPQVIHLYTITNNGPSGINEAEVLIYWPYATASGEDLMYLLEPPHVLGNVRCEGADFNYQGYKVEQRNKTIWEAFDIDVTKEESTTSKEVTKSESGIVVEQHEKKESQSSEHIVHLTPTQDEKKYESGDASENISEREQERGQHTTSIGSAGGQSILVTTGGSSGAVSKSETMTQTQTYRNTSFGPGGTAYTYTKNTTIVMGPHGEIIRNESSSYGNKQNLLRRSNDNSISGQHSGTQTIDSGIQTIDSGTQTIDSGSSVRVVDGKTYQLPYISVEYDITRPQMQNRNFTASSSSYNQYQGQQHPRHQYHTRIETSHHQDGQYGSNRHEDENYRQQTGHYQSGQGSLSSSYNKTAQSSRTHPALGAAVLGQDSKTEFLDLGVLDRNQYLSKQSTQFTERNAQAGIYNPDLDRIEYTTSKPRVVYKSRTYSGERSGGQHDAGAYVNYHQSEGGSQTRQESHERHWTPSEARSYNLNIGAVDEQPENFIHRRKKRQQASVEYDLRNAVQCKATKCKYLKCFVGPMLKDEEATIALRTRINVNTLKNISSSQAITFSTMMVGKITSVPFIGIPSQKETVKYEVTTNVVAPEADTKPDVVPLWIVVLSAVAGALILLLLIFLFYKCGFFKRNRPTNVPERQPLNRNGHFSSGDEAL